MNHYFTTIPTTALALGALVGGKMLNNGRRTAMIVMNAVGIVGSILSVYPNYYALIVGRGLYCLSAGVLIAAVPRILEETIPADKYDSGFGASTNLAVDGIVMINSILIMFMPKALPAKPVPTAD